MAFYHNKKDDVHAYDDYSCYITIRNLSDEDFGLDDFGIVDGYGVWPAGQPLNTIEAHSEPTVQLKDPKVLGGSEGWVVYEVPVGEETATFRLDFSDPEAPWSKNYLKAQSSRPDSLIVSVEPYKESGHPFYGIVNVKLKTSEQPLRVGKLEIPCSTRAGQLSTAKVVGLARPPESSDGSVHVKYDIGFDFISIVDKPPVHESIAMAAFIKSKKPMPKGTTYNNLNDKQWEYMRGLVWNDDPSCYLFDDYSDDNHHFSDGLRWLSDFRDGPRDCMIQRSHFGDLQFLHGMAPSDGEEPKETQRKVLKWLEIMYKLARGDQGVSEQDQLKQHLAEWFNDSTKPSGQSTLRDMLLASTPYYNHVDIQRRALGLCLHIIADSYAIGHTQRRLKNPEAYQGRNSDGYLTFKPGMYGDWGSIVRFHCYRGQNADRHSYYDGLEGAPLPVPKDLESFNRIIGARSAIDSSIKLINHFADGTGWEDGVETFLANEVFGIDKDAKPSNSEVDQSDPISIDVLRASSGLTCDSAYQLGLLLKSDNLEAVVRTAPALATPSQRAAQKSLRLALLFITLLSAAAMLSALVTQRVWIF